MRENITDAQWVIMRALWRCGQPMTSAEIVAYTHDGRSPRTIKTLLQRLVAKGLITYTQDTADSRVYHYSPAVSEDECMKEENANFVRQHYKGDVANMLARFIGDSKLEPGQIESLKALLSEKEENDEQL